MKKILLITIVLLSNITLFAQNGWRNRLLLHQDGDTVVYKMDKIDSLAFTKVAEEEYLEIYHNEDDLETISFNSIDSVVFDNVHGKVAANISMLECTMNSLTLNVTRTASCVAYKMMCVPYSSINSMSDESIAETIDGNVNEIYDKDFDEVTISDLQFEYDTEYAIVAVGIDKYGLLCDVTRYKFVTPSENLKGNPNVEITLVDNNYYDFSVRFVANDDVSKFYVILSEIGAIEKQYKMFSGQYGWTCIGDMVADWGLEFKKMITHQWTDKSPGMDYEIYVQAFDHDSVMAPYKVFRFKSKEKGGEGVAKVDIALGKYEYYVDWDGEALPSQYLTFTPNDQTSVYNMSVCLEENYVKDKYYYQEDLYEEPSMPTPGWFQYEELTTDYQIDPNTKCVAIAAAKNINGEWGPVTELYFTTPDEEAPVWSANPSKNIVGRVVRERENVAYEKEFQSVENIIHLIIP